MKEKETITTWQLAGLFISYMTGSTAIYIPAPLTEAAKSGAWLSLVVANGLGLLLLGCVLYLYRQYPGASFIEYSRKAVGNGLTLLITIPLLILVVVCLSLIMINLGGFFVMTMMKETPRYIFVSLLLLISALTVQAGIEVMARMFTLLFGAMLLLTIIVLVLAIPFYQPEFLLPVLPDGIKPVLHGAYLAFGFPYAELIFFSMLFPFARKEKDRSLNKIMVSALFLQGFILVASILCSIMAFGPMTPELKFSLFQLARLINVADFIERIESIISISIVIGSYMKTTTMLLIASLIVSKILKSEDERIFIFPIALLVLLISLTLYSSEIEFNQAITVVWPLLISCFVVLPLFLVTAVTAVKARWLKKTKF